MSALQGSLNRNRTSLMYLDLKGEGGLFVAMRQFAAGRSSTTMTLTTVEYNTFPKQQLYLSAAEWTSELTVQQEFGSC